jgi:hypothetical protein
MVSLPDELPGQLQERDGFTGPGFAEDQEGTPGLGKDVSDILPGGQGTAGLAGQLQDHFPGMPDHLRPGGFAELKYGFMVDRLFQDPLNPEPPDLVEEDEEIGAVFGLSRRELVDDIDISDTGKDIMIA